jgi:hypothetical protein
MLRSAAIVHAAPLWALHDHPQEVWQLHGGSVLGSQLRRPQPAMTTAFAAFDFNDFVWIVRESAVVTAERPEFLVRSTFSN